MRLILAILFLAEIQLHAQQVTITNAPGNTKNKLGSIYQRANGGFYARGLEGGKSAYFSLDKDFNIKLLDTYHKELNFTYPTPAEIGNVFYELAIRYDNKANILNFVAWNPEEKAEPKIFHSLEYSWKENGFFGPYYTYILSPDKQKFLILWQHPKQLTHYSIYEFDKNLKLVKEHSIETGFDEDAKKRELPIVNFKQVDDKGNLLLVFNSKKGFDSWLFKYRLSDQKLVKHLIEKPEDYDHLKAFDLDMEHSILYLAAPIKNPEPGFSILGINLDDHKTTVSLGQEIAKVYTYNIETDGISSEAINLKPEEIDAIRNKRNFKIETRQLNGPFRIRKIEANVLKGGNCALTIAFGFEVNYGNGGVSVINTDAILRTYDNNLKKVSSALLNVGRVMSDPKSMVINGELYYFTTAYTPENLKLDKMPWYKIDAMGKVKDYDNNEKYILSLFQEFRIHSGKIPMLNEKWEMVLIDCK